VVRFEELPQYIGQAVPVAKSGDLVLPLQIIRGGKLELRLGPAGRVEGRLVDDLTGDPIRAATVTLRPAFMSGFALHATTDADGRYTIEDVPPGVYHVEPSAPTHFDKPPRGQASERPDVKVREAAATAASFRMKRVARVRGAVADERGAPVAGAIVGMPCTWDGDYRDQNRYVLTDPEGRFDIATGHAAGGADRNDEPVHVAAFSSRHGLADVEIRPLTAGEVRDGVTLTLSGAARVRGAVKSPGGKPVAGVQCVAAEANVTTFTDDGGRFDLGWIPLIKRAEDGRPTLQFRAPRPPAGPIAAGAALIVADPVAGHPQRESDAWYQDATRPLDATAGAEVDLNVALEPTELLMFEGRVATRDGRPAAGARVFLFAGNAGADTWLGAVMPNVGSSRVVTVNERLLTQGAADEQGNWRLRAVRADGEATAAGGTRFSVGVVLPPRDGQLVRNVRLPAGASGRELDILVDRVPAEPPGGHLAPRPPAGAPAPGIRQRENAERAGQK
jgi:protocatechuate 3,4-dioxygenase beta subunit